MRGRVLIVAGSDSGGGAGLQADIKTITVLGGFAMTAVTALTAQNTHGVAGIYEVPADFVGQQMRLVLEDIGADAVKVGMLHNMSVIKSVAEALDSFASNIPLVVDPVMVAKGGASLLEEDAISALQQYLIPRASLITPNIPEAQQLCWLKNEPVSDSIKIVQALKNIGSKATLLTGGHAEGDYISDYFIDSDGAVKIFKNRRIQTKNTHGTGCTTSSAVAVGLAQGLEMKDAIRRALKYVHKAIQTAPNYGSGHGPINHGHPL